MDCDICLFFFGGGYKTLIYIKFWVVGIKGNSGVGGRIVGVKLE